MIIPSVFVVSLAVTAVQPASSAETPSAPSIGRRAAPPATQSESTPPARAPSTPAGQAPATTPGPAETAPSSTAALPVLHLDEAVREALAAQPTLREARAQVRSAEALASQARAGLLPQLSASAAYQRKTANYTSPPGSLPSTVPGSTGRTQSTTSWNTYDYFSGGATLSQTLFDLGTIQGFRSAESSARAQAQAELASQQSAVLAVEQAFFAARGAKAMLRVAQETLANQQRHLEQIQGYVEVGTRPQIDLVQARADVANSQVQSINAENAYRTAKVQLATAMGREGLGDFEVADDQLPEIEGENAAPQVLLDEALRARPELRELDARVKAQELQISAAKGSYLPALGVSTTGSYGGTSLSSLGWNWNAQAVLTWQLFQGGLTAAQVENADAQLALIRAQRDALRQQVTLELEQARLAVGAAKAALSSSRTALENATERLALAEARYQTGVGNIIELADAQLAEANAAGQRVQAEYNLSTARAQLARALGRD